MTDLLEKYATRALPRYTSYPTVPHFHDGIGAEKYAGWLADLAPDEPISLYLHVPFCHQLCWYCGCNMKLANRDSTVLNYAATLMKEVRLVAQHLPARMKVSHLHWGGGTPTSLSIDALSLAMDTVRADFEINPDAELAIESDPRTLKDAMIARIGALGFNRASFGVQEFDPKVQKAINRIQPPDMVRACVGKLRDAGVKGINFDLIYGLPHQTVESLTETIRLCAEMRPDRIALFGYAHVPWMAKRQRLIDENALPGGPERLAQAKAAAQALEAAGYVAIGLDHFALPSDPLAKAAAAGTLRRNFQGYTTDGADTLLGLGATSIGRTPFGFIQNIAETGAWARAVEARMLPVGKGHEMRPEDHLRGRVIERLMCQGSVDLDAEGATAGADPAWYQTEEDALSELLADGVIAKDGGRLEITDAGAPYMRVVASVFDTYYRQGAARHSVAV